MAKEKPLILLVEDNPDDEKLTLRAMKLSKLEGNIVVARDGAEALEALFGLEAILPNLVVLDLKLPKVSGLEVLQKVRADERTQNLPIVVLTSSDEEKDITESYSLGANSYVRKPVDFDEFLDAVKQVGGYWIKINQPAAPAFLTSI